MKETERTQRYEDVFQTMHDGAHEAAEPKEKVAPPKAAEEARWPRPTVPLRKRRDS